MAKLRVQDDELVVWLSGLEKLGALRGDVHLPLAAVRSARVSDRPWSELRGIRAPGTGFPGVISLCTRRGSGIVDFAAVYRGGPAVVVDLEGAHFDRLVVTCDDATTWSGASSRRCHHPGLERRRRHRSEDRCFFAGSYGEGLWVRQLLDAAASSSTSRRLSALSSFYRHLAEHDLIAANPAAAVRRPSVDPERLICMAAADRSAGIPGVCFLPAL